MNDSIWGFPIVTVTTWLGPVAIVLCLFFLLYYAIGTPTWWRSPEGRMIFFLVAAILVFTVRGFLLRLLGRFDGSEWFSLGAYVLMLSCLGYASFLLVRANRRRRQRRHDPRRFEREMTLP